MVNKFKLKTKFSRNVLTLMTGTTIAQAIPVVASPILTRLYTPKDFGLLALFMAIVSIVAGIVNGKYELAILLPKKNEDAINIFALGLLINMSISIILLLIITIFHNVILQLLNNKDISVWLYFVPLAVFCIGLFNNLTYFNNRKEFYKDISNAMIIKSIVLIIAQVSIGFFKHGAMGLISGEIVSRLIANGRLYKNIFIDNEIYHNIKKVKIFALAKKYKNFPKFSVFATLTNTSSYNIVNIYIPIMYNINKLGYYSLMQRVLAGPTALIGTSISKVFFKEAAIEKQATGMAINTYMATIKKSFFISAILFSCIFFSIEDLVGIVFGKQWITSAIYAKMLIPLFFIRFIMTSVSLIETVMEKQKIFLYFNICLLISTIVVIFISYCFSFDIKIFLILYSIFNSIIYTIYIYIMYKMAKNEI